MNNFLETPSTDFQRVRDNRTSLPLYIDIDLSASRSLALGTALNVNISGNSFFVDADTTNGGVGVVHFQDTNFGIASAPFFVAPGFIASVGFTQIAIENTAQVGKRLRIFYGVDIDFQAGVNATVALTGRVDVNDIIGAGCQILSGAGAGSVGTVVTAIVAPATNINGILVRNVAISNGSSGAGGSSVLAVVASATAPTGFANKTSAITLIRTASVFPNLAVLEQIMTRRIPAGWGIYLVEGNAVTTASNGYDISLEIL